MNQLRQHLFEHRFNVDNKNKSYTGWQKQCNVLWKTKLQDFDYKSEWHYGML